MAIARVRLSLGLQLFPCFKYTHSWKFRRSETTNAEYLEEDFPGLNFYQNTGDVNAFLFETKSQNVCTSPIQSEVRVRYAPSPTGELHLGGLRTAYFNYLYAKKHDGKFFLRIEDTDRTRYQKQSISSLLNNFMKLEILPDNIDQLVLQSRRTSVYQHFAHLLIEKGYAYYCFCSQEALSSFRENAKQLEGNRFYNRHCYYLTKSEIQEKLDAKIPYVIRMKVPTGEKLIVDDIVKGKKIFDLSHVDDQIILKSDGFPTYHLASVVDDHFMKISHVIRGEEWLSSLPKHALLYKYFEWEQPKFAHLPLLLNTDRSKLSKRQQDSSVVYYFNQGLDKDVILNYVAQLGWSPPGDTQNFIPVKNLISLFDLDRINDSGAMVDLVKLKSLNSQYLRLRCEEDMERFMKEVKVIFEKEVGKEELSAFSDSYIQSVIYLTTSRMNFIADYAKIVYFFLEPKIEEAEIKRRFSSQAIKKLLRDFITETKNHQNFPSLNLDDWTSLTNNVCKQNKVNVGKLYAPLRYLLTGSEVGASVVDTLNLLSANVSLPRVLRYFDYFPFEDNCDSSQSSPPTSPSVNDA